MQITRGSGGGGGGKCLFARARNQLKRGDLCAVHIAVSRGSFSDCQKRDSFEKPSEELVSFRVNYRPRNLRPGIRREGPSVSVSGEGGQGAQETGR